MSNRRRARASRRWAHDKRTIERHTPGATAEAIGVVHNASDLDKTDWDSMFQRIGPKGLTIEARVVGPKGMGRITELVAESGRTMRRETGVDPWGNVIDLIVVGPTILGTSGG